jgi:hypothetical protein
MSKPTDLELFLKLLCIAVAVFLVKPLLNLSQEKRGPYSSEKSKRHSDRNFNWQVNVGIGGITLFFLFMSIWTGKNYFVEIPYTVTALVLDDFRKEKGLRNTFLVLLFVFLIWIIVKVFL